MKEYPFCMVLDIGTTNIKCCIVSFEGSVISQAITLTPHKKEKYQELNPEEIWIACLRVIKKAVSHCLYPKEIKAMIVIGMAATYLPLSNTGDPLSSFILWNDSRASKETSSLSRKLFLDARLKASIGQYPLPMYLPFKIRWMQKNSPSIISHTRWWVNITDYINMRLTKRKTPVTDYSIASRTMLLNHKNLEWNHDLLQFFEIDDKTLPDLLNSGSEIGFLDDVLADEIGLNRSVRIILGTHDHICTALGSGTTIPGIILNSVGTSEAILTPILNHHKYQGIIENNLNLEEFLSPDSKALVGYVAPTGSILAPWLKSGIAKQVRFENLQNDFIYFKPPSRYMKIDSSGILHLSGANFSPQQIFKAIIFGLGFEMCSIVEKMTSIVKCSPGKIIIAGGLAQYKYINQMKADLLNVEIENASEIRLEALGGYILCGYGLGLFKDMSKVSLDIYSNIHKEIYIPDTKRHDLYENMYHKYLHNISQSTLNDSI